MAISNQDRVGRAMDLLRAGLAPFVEREFKSQHKTLAAEAARRYFADDRSVGKKPVAEWDVAALLKLMWEAWNDVFSKTLGRAEARLYRSCATAATSGHTKSRSRATTLIARSIRWHACSPLSRPRRQMKSTR
jgi:hypothetical protein